MLIAVEEPPAEAPAIFDPLTASASRRYRARVSSLVFVSIVAMFASAVSVATLPDELVGLTATIGAVVAPVLLIFGCAGLLQSARMRPC